LAGIFSTQSCPRVFPRTIKAEGYCTVRVTVTLCVIVPEVALITNCELPGGVPSIFGLTVPPVRPAQPDRTTPVRSSSASGKMVANLRTLSVLRNSSMEHITASRTETQSMSPGISLGVHGISMRGAFGAIAVVAVVVTVKVTGTDALFGVTELGLKAAVVADGKPETLKLATLENPFAVGDNVSAIPAC